MYNTDSQKKIVEKPRYHRIFSYLDCKNFLAKNTTKKAKNAKIDIKIPRGYTRPYCIQLESFRSGITANQASVGLPIKESPKSKNTHNGTNAAAKEKNNVSTRLYFSDFKNIFLKNLRRVYIAQSANQTK